jgi:hypothetical protein
MDYISFHARQSGRTSRMIEKALELQKEGRAVYILCASEAIPYTRSLAHKICELKGIKFPETIKFETVQSLGGENIDWQNKKLHRSHPNCSLLIDHHVWAQKFHWAIQGFHEYDDQNLVSSKHLIELAKR